MATARLKVNVGRTYNTGNYESLRVDVGLEADFDDSTLESHYQELFTKCEQALRREAQRLIKAIEDQHR